VKKKMAAKTGKRIKQGKKGKSTNGARTLLYEGVMKRASSLRYELDVLVMTLTLIRLLG